MKTSFKTALCTVIGASFCWGCSSETTEGEARSEAGALGLALTVEGYEVSSVTINIASNDVERTRTISVEDSNATLTATEFGLPPDTYTVSLSASVIDDPNTPNVDESTSVCEGSVSGVVVEAAKTTEVDNLILVCTIDGGKLQTAGGIRVKAQIDANVLNNCPDLIDSAFLGALDASVGSSVSLAAVGKEDVSVAWTATAGIVASDQASYTCPATPGTYTLQATFTRDEECQQVFQEQVNCHSNYSGPVETLPSSFAFTGSCNLTGPCHVTQDGKAWSATCGSRPHSLTVIKGEAVDQNSFPFSASNGRVCTGEVVDGELVGVCADAAGATCTFVSDSNPAQPLACPLVDKLEEVNTCTGSYAACEVAQQGCNILAKCGEDKYLGRDINADGSVRVEDYADSKLFTCQGTVDDGITSGSCTETGSDIVDPLTCDFSASVTLAESVCEATMPSAGFLLEGCGFDDLCFARQRGCVWEVACSGGVYSGVAAATDAFEFTGPSGEICSASVVDGEFVGSCGSGSTACTFAAVAPVADSSCMDVPDVVAARGCGFATQTPFDVIQDGCRFMGYAPSRGVFVNGDVTASGLSFVGIGPGWTCSAEISDEVSTELWGGCTRENADGTVSLCRDFTSTQGSRLVIAL